MKIRTVWILFSLVLVLTLTTVTLAESSALREDTLGSQKRGQKAAHCKLTALTGEIDYWFTGHLNIRDEENRRLIWEGTIEGDVTGTMKWWFGPSPAQGGQFLGGRVGYYAGRWEIWDGDRLLLAGESAGKTVTLGEADGMWDGHGVVTEARGAFNCLKGRHIYETGPVVWEPFPFSGVGLFQIY